MVKKRGGRRGKGNKQEDQPPEVETLDHPTPSTSQQKPEVVMAPQVLQPMRAWSQESQVGRGQRQPGDAPQPVKGAFEPNRKASGQQQPPPVSKTGGGDMQPWGGAKRREGVTSTKIDQMGHGQGRFKGRGIPQRQPDTPQPGRGASETRWEAVGHRQPFQGGDMQPWGGAKPREDVAHSSPATPAWGRGQGRGKGRGIPQRQPGDAPEPGHQQPLPALKAGGGDMQPWGGAKPREGVASTSKVQSELQSLNLGGFEPGTKGRKIRIETNHLRLNLGNLKTIYRYDVSIIPEKKPKKMYRQAFQLFQAAHFPGNHPGYDGQKLVVSAKRLPLDNDTKSAKVTLTTDRNEQFEFTVTIKLTGTVDLSGVNNLLQKKNIEEIYQCVEIVLKQAYVNSFLNVGRRFYTPSSGQYNLGCGTEMYLGGYQAVVQGSVPFLNVDVAHKAFTTATSLPNLILEMFSKQLTINGLVNLELKRWQFEQLNNYLKNLKVIYQIPSHPGSKRIYKINGLAEKASLEKFENEGKQTTVEQYFKNKWHSPLKFPNLPTLWVGSTTKRICVPIEMCVLKEGQPIDGSALLGAQTSKMIGYSATPSYERKKKILDITSKANHNSNKCVQEFGFSVNPNFEKLDARVLPPPTLQYFDDKVDPKCGIWRARQFQDAVHIKKWTILGFGLNYEQTKDNIFDLVQKLKDYGRKCKMIFDEPETPFDLKKDQRALRAAFDKKKNYDLVIVVFSSFNKDSYYIVKQESEQQIGLLTQCIKIDTLKKLNDSTIRNILLKINAKLNGTNHIVHNFDLISSVPTMIMGADVTHPSPQARTIPSIVAVTASHDLTATKYNATPYLQKPRETFSEIIQQLETITLQKLKIFKEHTKKLPERIYFLRDGVSDGEFDRIKEHEVKAIKSACFKYQQNYNPKLTFIVVQKRHHTRFFPTDQNSKAENDRNCNVPVGTYVDTVITDPTIQSFYLMSHQSIKGVGRPTKYCVLFDENKLTNDDVEMLTFYLCHLYVRCNRSVSYPAPTYYAHLAADRFKVYLHNKRFDLDNLDQKLVAIREDFAKKNPMHFS